MDYKQRRTDSLVRRSRHKFVPSLAACGILCLWTNFAVALDFERVVWGFDGQVVPYRFNLLSVEVANNTPEAFAGVLELRKTFGGRQRTGARLIEPVFVAPFTRKRVQFYPYVMQEWDEWRLVPIQGGRSEKSFELKTPTMGKPARIILTAEDNLFAPSGGMRRFPEDIFPTMVTATDGLAAVVLDHVPRWGKNRSQAFVDWLHRGGKVHLCFNAGGTFPQFPESLAVLNSPLEKNRVGSGFVLRHSRTLYKFDDQFVRREILELSDSEQDAQNATDNDAANANQYYNSGDSNILDRFFYNLQQMTRPDHNWGVIHLMSMVYILLIFPGCFLLGRRRADYRITYSVILGLVLVFSLAFRSVGRRGYGESTAVNSVAVARPLEGGYYDVTQWTNTFVIDGADYRISHEGTGRLYSTAQNTEAVSGVIDSGTDGTFDVDIPPYSNRSFTHRVKIKAEPISLNVDAWEAGETLKKLVLKTGGAFPKNSKQIYALFHKNLYRMTNRNGRLTLNGGSQPLSQALGLNENDNYRYRMYGSWNDRQESPEQIFRSLHHPLIAASLGVSDVSQLENLTLPDDRVRVFVYAPASEEFFITGDRFGSQAGYVLYCIDVFNPEEL